MNESCWTVRASGLSRLAMSVKIRWNIYYESRRQELLQAGRWSVPFLSPISRSPQAPTHVGEMTTSSWQISFIFAFSILCSMPYWRPNTLLPFPPLGQLGDLRNSAWKRRKDDQNIHTIERTNTMETWAYMGCDAMTIVSILHLCDWNLLAARK